MTQMNNSEAFFYLLLKTRVCNLSILLQLEGKRLMCFNLKQCFNLKLPKADSNMRSFGISMQI